MSPVSQIKEKTTQQFMEAIIARIRDGYGITPYTGAGVSATSGIMLGESFTNYLTWVIWRCVSGNPHDIRMDGWPSLPSRSEVDKCMEWVGENFREICRRYGTEVTYDRNQHLVSAKPDNAVPWQNTLNRKRPIVPRSLGSCRELEEQDRTLKELLLEEEISSYLEKPNDPRIRRDSRTGLQELAVRSMFDWRAMLDFLTRVTIRSGKIILTDRDPGVIDSFHQHITHGRKPNLTHSMLAHLSGPLRIRTLITTNFDSLHEQAFQSLGIPYERHDVSLNQGMPAIDTVRATTSIIKLHGSQTGTRADFSLDRPPTQKENEIFYHYITGHSPDDETESGWIPSHLLAIGASGEDTRCLHLMKYVLDTSPEARIFWICYNFREFQKMKEYFKEKEYADRLVVTVTDRPGLLLLELYQNITLTLPKGGYSYHYSQDVPPTLWRDETGPVKLQLAPRESVDAIVRAITNPVQKTTGVLGVVWICPTFRSFRENCCDKDTSDAQTNRINRYKQDGRRLVRGEEDDPSTKDLINAGLWLEVVEKKYNYQQAIEAARACCDKRKKNEEKDKDGTNDGAPDLIESGLIPVMAQCLHILQNEHNKDIFWLEMEDCMDVPSLLQELFHIISLRRGLFQLEHAVLLPARIVERRKQIKEAREKKRHQNTGQPEEHPKDELEEMWSEVIRNAVDYLGGDLDCYVACLYGRNVPGSSTGWEPQGRIWGQEDYLELDIVMRLICRWKLNILYVPLTSERIQSNAGKISKLGLRGVDKPSDLTLEKHQTDDKAISDDTKHIRQDVIVIQFPVATQHPFSLTPGKSDSPESPGVIENLRMIGRRLDGELKTKQEEREKKNQTEKDAVVDDDNELRLLYAVSQFRQSRPPSVFLTDPVYPSKHRFNAYGIDSDWAKKQEVTQWLESYRKCGLMWRKRGGNSWMYRDGLVGLRLILEYPSDEHVKLREKKLMQSKSRTHFWIARWYFRAFCSSTHGIPLTESFYHFYQSIIRLPNAIPPDDIPDSAKSSKECYHWQRLIRALAEWIKVIRLGRSSLMYWFTRPDMEGWIGKEARDSICVQICEVKIKLQNNIKRSDRLYVDQMIEELMVELERCHLDLQRNLSTPSDVWAYCNFQQIGQPPATSPKTPRSCKIHKNDLFRKGGPNWNQIPDNHLLSKEAEKLLNKCFRSLKKNDGGKAYGEIKSLVLNHFVEHESYTRELPLILAILKERLYLLVRDAKIREFKAALDSAPKASQGSALIPSADKARRQWKSVTILGRLIIEFCTFCPPVLVSFDMNVRVATLTLHALALARLGRFFQAHRRLNEAHALQTRIPAHIGDVKDFAIIELRRSEAYLLEADQVSKLLELAGSSGDAEQFLKAMEVPGQESANKNTVTLQDQLIDVYGLAEFISASETAADGEPWKFINKPGLESKLRQILVAKLDDAWSSLETSEFLLSGQIRTSFSWGRLCTLKLRLFAHHSREEIGNWKILAQRRRQNLSREFSRWLRLGFSNWPDDPFRKLRLAWYFLNAKANWPDLENHKEDSTLFVDGNPYDEQDIQLLLGLFEKWAYKDDQLVEILKLQSSFLLKIGMEISTSSETFDSEEMRIKFEQHLKKKLTRGRLVKKLPGKKGSRILKRK